MSAFRPRERLDVLATLPLLYQRDGHEAFKMGASVYGSSLLAGLAELGYTVRAIATYPHETEGLTPNELPGVDVDWFAIRALSLSPDPPALEQIAERRAKTAAALDRALAVRRPDVVLLGNEAQPLYAADLCRELGLPTVLTAHGVPTATFLSGNHPKDFVRLLADHLARVDRIAAVARHLEGVLRALGDTEAFRPRERDRELQRALGIEPDRVVIGSFSHFRPEKRLPEVAASAAQVLRAEPRALYLFAGDGPERQAAAELLTEVGLGDRVRFVGELDSARVPEHMALCDAVVLASETEGCPLVVLEAQASGLPVVCSEIPGNRELVEHGETGLLFEVGDTAGQAERTLELVRDEPLRRALGGRARAAALAHGRQHWLRACSDLLGEAARAGVAP